MPQSFPDVLIFTDLDGTLLDHHNYSAVPANLLIEQIQTQLNVQVIPVTSKTRAELELMEELRVLCAAPAVFENGSVVGGADRFPFFRSGQSPTLVLGVSYQEILNRIASLPASLRKHIQGFNDMSVAEIADSTGLSIDSARAAKQREATEPFLWSGSNSEMSELQSTMNAAGIKIQQGGRFFHFTGEATKIFAVQQVLEAYQKSNPQTSYVTIALGDGPNDLKMIEAADHGVIMPNPDGAAISSNKAHVQVASAPGPKGWVASVSQILDELGFNVPDF
ncbi:mannosyl-3-phosphoglycerate phosphatase-related protein [Parasphingorhabdus litoris]|uniref:Mannosyl-3-phosphoglycerate phosphatase-related protein n=1 Tax=Parasphingorhabdus litoris TaxID=394733 RepID=A0ABP3KE81_9SPHN|nr:HAD-IIB family hydrolase [Parasphingorhabdus litoris]